MAAPKPTKTNYCIPYQNSNRQESSANTNTNYNTSNMPGLIYYEDYGINYHSLPL